MIHPDRWSPADVPSLEKNALAAARETHRNLALTAGPGAGKTEMLAQRADFLLRTGACRYPRRILAIAFKIDASQNLKARVKKRCGDELASRLDSHTFHAFAMRIISRFRAALSAENALDSDFTVGTNRVHRKVITYDDMVPLAIEIVRNSAIARNAIRQTYSHVFLDEFQDCTTAQYRLIKACFAETAILLTAVGDTKQRIMGWAGALEGIFSTYAADFDALPLNLYQNFRSKPLLRRMQNAMVKVMDPNAALDDADIPGDEGEAGVCRYDDCDDEACDVAASIRGWIEDEGLSPSEIAILVRVQQSQYCKKLCDALAEQGIPYREEDANQNLAAEPIACLVVDFLLVVAGGRQPAPYGRLLDLIVFSRGLDEEREYQTRARWDRFVAETRKQIRDGDLDLSDRSDLETLATSLIGIVGRDAVVAMSNEYSQAQRLDQLIGQTLDRVSDTLGASPESADALSAFAGDKAVRIMSIHKSKGLEFDTVVVLGVEHEAFFGSDVAEKRSTFFVAISRAKRRLFVTVCDQRERPDGVRRWDVQRKEFAEFVAYVENVT